MKLTRIERHRWSSPVVGRSLDNIKKGETGRMVIESPSPLQEPPSFTKPEQLLRLLSDCDRLLQVGCLLETHIQEYKRTSSLHCRSLLMNWLQRGNKCLFGLHSGGTLRLYRLSLRFRGCKWWVAKRLMLLRLTVASLVWWWQRKAVVPASIISKISDTRYTIPTTTTGLVWSKVWVGSTERMERKGRDTISFSLVSTPQSILTFLKTLVKLAQLSKLS